MKRLIQWITCVYFRKSSPYKDGNFSRYCFLSFFKKNHSKHLKMGSNPVGLKKKCPKYWPLCSSGIQTDFLPDSAINKFSVQGPSLSTSLPPHTFGRLFHHKADMNIAYLKFIVLKKVKRTDAWSPAYGGSSCLIWSSTNCCRS